MNESLLILLLTATSCSLMGAILYYKESLMVADAISHTSLLGIVLVYFLIQDLNSPFLVIGASLIGLITVFAIDALSKARWAQNDAAIGIVYPGMFALAILLMSKYFRNSHLCIDIVLMGDIILVPYVRTEILGYSFPTALLYSLFNLAVILIFVFAVYPRLKLRLFDSVFAQSLSIKITGLDIIIMTLVAMTCVISFQIIGATLVLSMMVGPVLTASLLSQRFSKILLLSVLISSWNCIIGYFLANALNVSITGLIAFFSLFSLLLLLVMRKQV